MNSKILIWGVVAILAVAAVAVVIALNNSDETPMAYPDNRLWVFGNANGDDHIDQKDIDYLEALIAGKEGVEKTEFADANQDGKIDQKDVDHVKDMISKKPMKIYYLDVDLTVSSINYPINYLLPTYQDSAEILVVLDLADKVVGAEDLILTTNAKQFGFDVPTVGNRFNPNVEVILSLKEQWGDLTLFGGTREHYYEGLEDTLNGTGIQIVRLPSFELGLTATGVCTAGFLFDRVAEADAYLEWHDRILNTIEERVATIDEKDRVSVLVTVRNGTRGIGSGYYENTVISGGNNVAPRFGGAFNDVWDTESVLFVNPDIFINCIGTTYYGEKAGLTTARDDIKDQLPGYTGQIGIFGHEVANGPAYVISLIIYANWFYPDMFDDIDALEEFQFYLDNFTNRDLDVDDLAILII
jgi:ABC-type Fe3+-hydroxamate transport system, periplasmic component